jgi:hypothetical protein
VASYDHLVSSLLLLWFFLQTVSVYVPSCPKSGIEMREEFDIEILNDDKIHPGSVKKATLKATKVACSQGRSLLICSLTRFSWCYQAALGTLLSKSRNLSFFLVSASGFLRPASRFLAFWVNFWLLWLRCYTISQTYDGTILIEVKSSTSRCGTWLEPSERALHPTD